MAQQIRNLVRELLIWLTMMTIWAWSQPLICPVIYHNLEFIFRIFNDSISFGANPRLKPSNLQKDMSRYDFADPAAAPILFTRGPG